VSEERTLPSGDDEFVGFVREYLLQVVTVHHELMRRMILAEPSVARDLANLLDDAAKTYRDLSAMISANRDRGELPPAEG
jgi:hypothetical protein